MNTTSIQSAKSTIDLSWHILSIFTVLIVASMLPDVAAAANTNNPFEDVLCKVVGFFTSTTGKAIATLAVIFIGVGALMGKISWGLAFIVAIGIALVFGAEKIVNLIAPSGTGSGCNGATV